MFDIGWGELVVIGIVALIAIGPKELPTVLRTLGQYMAKVRRMASDFQGQFQEAMREAELHDLKKQAEDMTSSVTDFSGLDPMADVQKDVEGALKLPELDSTGSTTSDADKGEPAKHDAPDEAAGPATEASPESNTALPEIDVPPVELPAPVSEKDFAADEAPVPKKAGSKA